MYLNYNSCGLYVQRVCIIQCSHKRIRENQKMVKKCRKKADNQVSAISQ